MMCNVFLYTSICACVRSFVCMYTYMLCRYAYMMYMYLIWWVLICICLCVCMIRVYTCTCIHTSFMCGALCKHDHVCMHTITHAYVHGTGVHRDRYTHKTDARHADGIREQPPRGSDLACLAQVSLRESADDAAFRRVPGPDVASVAVRCCVIANVDWAAWLRMWVWCVCDVLAGMAGADGRCADHGMHVWGWSCDTRVHPCERTCMMHTICMPHEM